jgi:hypothetical protein
VANELVHLTSQEAVVSINTSKKLGSKIGVFAIDADLVPKSNGLRRLSTLGAPGDLSGELRIPKELNSLFSRPPAFGPVSSTRRLIGTHSTPLGSLDLANNIFVRNEVFRNRVFRQATWTEKQVAALQRFALDYGADGVIFTAEGVIVIMQETGKKK